MLLWIIIIISLAFAWLGFKKGFFVMFAMLFNLMFAIFISVLSTRALMQLSSGYEKSGYYAAITVFLLFVLIFGVLQFFAYYYILKNREDYFPKIFDKAAATAMGFLCGYIICCLIVLMFCIMPCSRRGKIDWFCTQDNMIKISVPGVRKVCNFLGWYSLHCFEGDSEREIINLLKLSEAPTEGTITLPYLEAVENAVQESTQPESQNSAADTDQLETQ